MPTQLNGVKKVVVVDDGTNEKFVALGKWTATDPASSVIQTSTDATTWTRMDYVSDPYGGALRDGLITQEFDGLTFGEHTPPGTFYTDIGLPARSFRLPTIRAEYSDAVWKKFYNNATSTALLGITGNLSTESGYAYSALSTSKGAAWIIGVLDTPTKIASDEIWVDITSMLISGTLTYIAITNYGQVAKSTNGITWTYSSFNSLLTLTGERVQAVAAGAISGTNNFFAATNRNVYRSTNGTTWAKDNATAWSSYNVSDILVDNNYIMIVSSDLTTTLMKYRYLNGGAWVDSSPLGISLSVKRLIRLGDRYFIFNNVDGKVSMGYKVVLTGATEEEIDLMGTNQAPINSWTHTSQFPKSPSAVMTWSNSNVAFAIIDETSSIRLWSFATSASSWSRQGIAIPSNRTTQYRLSTTFNSFTTNGGGTATSGVDRIVLVDGFGNSYYQIYNTSGYGTALTSDYTDEEYQALAESLVQSSPNSTRYQQYLGFYGPGNRLPIGDNWSLMINDTYRKVAFNLASTSTARSDNYEVMIPAGSLNNARDWKDATFGAFKFVVVAQNGFEWSVNGTLWNTCTRPADAVDYVWRSIVYMPSNGTNPGVFYSVAEASNKVLTSKDGIIWEYTNTLPSSSNWVSSDSNNTITAFIKSGTESTCATADQTNPFTFTARTLPASRNWVDVIHGYEDKNYVADASILTERTANAPGLLADGYIKHNVAITSTTDNRIKFTGTLNATMTPVSLPALAERIRLMRKPNTTTGSNDLPYLDMNRNTTTGAWTIASLSTTQSSTIGTNSYSGSGFSVGEILVATSGGGNILEHPLFPASTTYLTVTGVSGTGAITTYTTTNLPAHYSGTMVVPLAYMYDNGAPYYYYSRALSFKSFIIGPTDKWKIAGGQFPGYSNGSNDITLDFDRNSVGRSTGQWIIAPDWPTNLFGWYSGPTILPFPNNFTLECKVYTNPSSSNPPTLTILSGGSYLTGISGIEFTANAGFISYLKFAYSSGTFTNSGNSFGSFGLPSVLVGVYGSEYRNINVPSNYKGYGLTVGTKLRCPGDYLGATTPGSDLYINVDSVDANGGVTGVSYVSGTHQYAAHTFSIRRVKNSFTINMVVQGTGQFVNNPLKIPGNTFSDVGGTTGVNDIVITPTAVDQYGAITAYTISYSTAGLRNGRFFALATGNKSAYSDDGITWTECTLPSSQTWTSVSYSKGSDQMIGQSNGQSVPIGVGLFIAVASGTNVIAYSFDAITWTQRTLPKSSTWKQVSFFKNRFIILDGTRYPLISNKFTLFGTTLSSIADSITWTDYGEEYLSYWTSTEMTDLVYIGGKYIGVGKGTLADGTVVPLVWKSTTLSGAKATWRLYGTANDLGQLSNIINVGGDFAFIAEDNAATPANAVKKFTSTFINDATTTGYKIPLSETSNFPGSDNTGYARIEAAGTKFYLTKKDDSVVGYDIS
jgi:hypothetical protein